MPYEYYGYIYCNYTRKEFSRCVSTAKYPI